MYQLAAGLEENPLWKSDLYYFLITQHNCQKKIIVSSKILELTDDQLESDIT